MTEAQKVVIDYAEGFIERSNSSSGIAAMYLACIAGMWVDTALRNPDLTKKFTPKLDRHLDWYYTGLDCSRASRVFNAT